MIVRFLIPIVALLSSALLTTLAMALIGEPEKQVDKRFGRPIKVVFANSGA